MTYKKSFSCYCTTVSFKANPGKWVQKKQHILLIHLSNSTLGIRFNFVLMVAISGRDSKSHSNSEGKKSEKYCGDSLLWLLTVTDPFCLWAMLLCSILLGFCCLGQICWNYLLPGYFLFSLRSSKKCETFSYTTKVIQQAGVTLIKLGAIPL